MSAERGFNPEKIGAEIIKFPVAEKSAELTRKENLPPLDPEERRQVLAEIFGIDKALAELEFDVKLLGEAMEIPPAPEKRKNFFKRIFQGEKKPAPEPSEDPDNPAYFQEAYSEKAEEIEALLAKRNELFARLSDEDKATLSTGLIDLRSAREAAGFFLPTKIKKESEKHLKNGEVLFESFDNPNWSADWQCFVIRRGDKFFLNGNKLLYEGDWQVWQSHPDGVVIEKDNKLLLNGEKLLYEGDQQTWQAHPDGVVIRKGNKLLLNGEKLLYEDERGFSAWSLHPDGVVIRKGNKLLLNGKKLLYEGDFIRWSANRAGVIIQQGGTEKKPVGQLLLNGKKLLYEGRYPLWNTHQDGVIIEEDGRLIFYNGKK